MLMDFISILFYHTNFFMMEGNFPLNATNQFIILVIVGLFVVSCSDFSLCCPATSTNKTEPQVAKETPPDNVQQPAQPTITNPPPAVPAATPTAETPANRLDVLRGTFKNNSLKERWHHKLLKEKIVNIYLVGKWVLVETDKANLLALDRETGIPGWMFTMNAPLDFKPVLYQDRLYLLNQAWLHILNNTSGSLLAKKDLPFIPCSPAVASDCYLYIGGLDNFIYALDLKTGDKEWRYRIDGYVHGTMAVLSNELFFGATDNRIYAIKTLTGSTAVDWGKNGRYTTRAPNIAGIVAQTKPDLIYAGSTDYNLYCLTGGGTPDLKEGNLKWKFESGGEIKQLPYIISNAIYFVADDLNKKTVMYVLNTENGQEKWKLEDGLRLWFIGKKHDWIVKVQHQLAAVNNETGKVISELDAKNFDIFVTNTQDNQGYAATLDGYIFAVEER